MIALFFSWVQEVYEGLHGTAPIIRVFEKYGSMFETLYSNNVFSSIIAVMQTVGITVCMVYFLLELADKATQEMLSLEQLFLLFLRLLIAYVLIANCIQLLKGFIDFGTALSAEIDEVNVASTLFQQHGDVIREGLEDISADAGIGYAIKLLIPYLIVLVSNVVVYFISISRSVELTIRVIFAPFAIANIYHDMQRSEGFRYLRKILALSLQVVVCLGICLAISAVLQTLGGDPDVVLESLENGKFNAEIFLDNYVLGGQSYMILLGILFARIGLLVKSMQLCSDLVGA